MQTQACPYVCTHAHTPVKAATFSSLLFRREGEGDEEAWHVRGNLLSTVARSPVPVIGCLGRHEAPSWLLGGQEHSLTFVEVVLARKKKAFCSLSCPGLSTQAKRLLEEVQW